MVIMRGFKIVIFMVVSHINWGQLIKERICSSESKFFLLRVDPFSEDLVLQVSKQEVLKIVSL